MMTGKVLYPSPMSSGVPKSANARMKTSRAAAMMVGMQSGITTVRNIFVPLRPMLMDASKSELSMFFSAPQV
ncbi:MAG: hypothetical protein BWY50_02007 [Spirochaetes bacterium ADurb.Bin315]|nr:MAG: hypothetical protein BWY50_02007 [Spirochaetes bacterium ADurb.Bin315]